MALLKQSTAFTRMFLIVQTADHLTGLTGASPTVTLSKAGGAFGAAAGTVTEVASGFYKIALTTVDTNTLGDLAFHITATSGDPTDFVDQISSVIESDLATSSALATVQADTDDIQTRLPAALVSGRIDASVGAMAANVLTATAINADAITAAKVADGTIDAATFAAGAINAAAIAADAITAAKVADGTIDAATFAAGAIDATAIATDAIGSNELAASAVAKIQTSVTAGAVASVTGNVGGNVTGSVGSVVGAVGSVTGAVGSVTGNVGGNVVGTVASVVGAVGSIATGGITAASFAADAITAAKVAADVGTEIATAVWASGTRTLTSLSALAADIASAVLDAVASSFNTAGSIGNKINSAGSAGDPWSTALPGAYSSGQAGFIVGTDLDATVSSRSSHSAAAVWAVATRALTDKAGFSLSSGGVQAIWDALTSALTTVGSIGKRLADDVDAAISTRLPTSSYTAPDNADILLIKAKTDLIPATPAAVGSQMTLDPAQALANSPTIGTVGYALVASEVQGGGDWVLAGTVLTLKRKNGTTFATFNIDSATDPTQRIAV